MTDSVLKTTCGYCSTGCNLMVALEPDSGPKVIPNPDHPVNQGSACPKGFLFLEPLRAPDRATGPLLRNDKGVLESVDWERAFEAFSLNFKRILAAHGPESVAFLGTGQLPVEEIAFLGALAKFGMGLVHGDGNTRQCMATAALAYKRAFGFDAPPFTYRDLEESEVLVFIGANPAVCHPIIWNRVKKNRLNPEIILIDPRVTETAARATRHLRIKPDSLLTFLHGLAHLLIKNNWLDQEFIDRHTAGFGELKDKVKRFTPAQVSQTSGIDRAELEGLARTIGRSRRVSWWWTMGINQNYQAVACAQAIINLALMTGNIGRPGTGANSITGQANAMGSRLFSNTTSLLGGYDFLNPEHRREVARRLGIEERLIPRQNSLAYDQILQGVEEGRIKGLWIVCTNPAHSWINKGRLPTVLKRLDYLVVQDIFPTTETARLADLFLAAAGCGEKEGTFINSERRLGVIRKIIDPPGSARSDFEIFKGLARAWGCADIFSAWDSPRAVFDLLKNLSQGRPCDISGIKDYEMIERLGGIQWPCPPGSEGSAQERRLFAEGRFFHPDGRARFIFHEPAPPPETAEADYPLILLTGRGTVAQWHTQTKTGKVEMLKKMYPREPYLDLHPDDAAGLGVEAESWVKVSSARGRVKVRARVTDRVGPGQVFLPMHYPETNILTCPHFDPHSREPSYKYAAVRVRPLNL